jgi:hypothetical protein
MKRSFHDFYERKNSFYSLDFPLTIEWGEAGRVQKYARGPLRYVLFDGEKPIGLFQGSVNKKFFISTLAAGSTSGNGMIIYPTYGPVTLAFFVYAVLEKEKFSSASIFVPNYVKVPGLSVKKNYTYHIDLTEPMENIVSKMTKECRWAIRKAEKSLVQVEISDSDDLLEEAYSIVSHTANAKNVGIPSFRWILELHARFKACGHSVSAVARHCREPVSAGYFLGYDEKLNWFIGGSTSKGYKLQAGNLVQMKVVEWAKNHGYRIYDVGGTHPIDPRYVKIHKFKSSFGGCLVTNYVLYRDQFYMPFLLRVKGLIGL